MEMFKIKFTYIILFLIIIYILYNFYFFDFEEYTVTNYWVGLDCIKLTNLVTSNLFLQEVITYIFFLFSLLLILFYFYQSKLDVLLVSYFFNIVNSVALNARIF